MYTQDYDGFYPNTLGKETDNVRDGSDMMSNDRTLRVVLIQPYIKNDKVFRCPNDTKSSVATNVQYFYMGGLVTTSTSFAKDVLGPISEQLEKSRRPTRILLGDKYMQHTSTPTSSFFSHFGEGGNYLYTDSSVVWRPLSQLKLQYSWNYRFYW